MASTRTAEVIASATMAAVFVAFFFAWPMPKETLSAVAGNPRSIADLHKNIALVGETGEPDGVLEIVLDEEEPLYEADVVTDLGRDALFIAQGLRKLNPELTSTKVRFAARLPVRGTERYPTLRRVLEVTWLWSDLLKVDAGGASSFQDLLNESRGVGYVTPASKDWVRAFCDDPLAKTARRFCQRELG
jgi:hypothetical protein